ncbi:hypothetical protein [Tistlia consotensis]|uniref:hypothetical protein n=1 Tax=Tistlia consotensis TaxID=1321365 RepID=UPI00117CC349|nr:hypothetical protein [Tistlia consotensis]
MRRLLGAPHLPLLQTLLREAGQNSCDAVAGPGQLRFVVRLRRLGAEERDALCQATGELPPPSESSQRLAGALAQPAPLVLEICDFGTRGLGGPTRADRSFSGVCNDFVDFVRNIGVSRDVAQGGGTYGYGKSILYRASRCATIIVDSLTEAGERRLIGCHLGDTVELGQGRLTGRHWWGVPSSETEDLVEPVCGDGAAQLAAALGLPSRPDGQTGTSIMVLDPDLQDDDLKSSGGEIVEALLWFFWPRMVAVAGVRRMVCVVEVEGEPLPVPDPEQFPPLDLFAEAWRAIKTGGLGAREVRSERPIRRLGAICLRTGLRNPRLPLTASGRTIIPQTSAHIAVMRPVELVVRYFEGPAFPNELQEWAGVFICDDAPDVEAAFALAEPPAHDDWDPEAMPKGPAKTYVNVALREIRKAAALWAAPPAIRTDGSGAGASLARAADMLGALVPDTRAPSRPGGSGGHRTRGWQVRDPEFIGLREGPGGVEAVFRVRAANLGLVALRLEARPGLVLDGVLSGENAGPNGDLARVIAWTDADGRTLATGDTLPLAPGASLDCSLSIAVPRLSAVGVAIAVGEPDA